MNNLNGKDTKLNEQENSTSNPDEITKKKFLKFFSNPKENRTDFFIELATAFGIVAVIVAILMPFIIKYFFLGDTNYKTYSSLGPIGDYIGGTTVAVLTAASVFLLLATIIMQRKEIKISQQGIDELVKQTAASVEQAEEARKEVVVTNETMARQQFENTFFNMIELHRNVSDNISYYKTKGNDGISKAFQFIKRDLAELTNEKFPRIYSKAHDYEDIRRLIVELQAYGYGNSRSVNLKDETEVITAYKKIDFEQLVRQNNKNSLVQKYKVYSREIIDEQLIRKTIETFIEENERLPMRHFNSFAIIIDFLRKSQFEKKDKVAGEDNNKIYREILFSQLSSEEMVLIYYLAKYTSSNEWLLGELRTYNLFYPNLLKSLLLFGKTDIINIERLSS